MQDPLVRHLSDPASIDAPGTSCAPKAELIPGCRFLWAAPCARLYRFGTTARTVTAHTNVIATGTETRATATSCSMAVKYPPATTAGRARL